MDDKNENGSVSPWMAQLMPKARTLEANTQAEICVIGGGIAGLTTAYLLQKTGKSVVLVENNELGSGQTSRTTAHLAMYLIIAILNLKKFMAQKTPS